MADSTTADLGQPSSLDDELVALTLQMEEMELLAKQDKGKYRADAPPDFEMAVRSFRADLKSHKGFLDDSKLAQSIGAAVYQDGAVIAALSSENVQAHEDRQMALRLGGQNASRQTSWSLLNSKSPGPLSDYVSIAAETIAASSIVDFSDDEDMAGPSMSYAERQAQVLGKLAASFKCSVCLGTKPSGTMIKPDCEHQYCIECAKGLFQRATRDETLFPPRCCKKPISPERVTVHMTTEERRAFEAASIEFSTVNRVYCSSLLCGKFIPPALMDAGTKAATCPACGTRTCFQCKNGHHQGSDCPDDPGLRETRELAAAMGWQTCFKCQSLVQLRTGCNHMTCRCRAEFCYVCGAKWKTCRCAEADERRMYERAEEVVDRDAEVQLPLVERKRRVQQVHAELRDNHECEHPGRFQRLFGDGRRGFRCEMCYARHRKYILQCRHCYVNVCEDCRRNRI